MNEKTTAYNLLAHNTYKLASHAEHVYYPTTIDDIRKILQTHDEIFILGNGSNIIFTQEIYKRLAFVILREKFTSFSILDNQIEAQAGVTLKQLSIAALEHNLSNLEVFYDIPATVGGALWMNAGAYGESIYDYVSEVTTLNRETNQIKTYPISKIQYSYRHSMFQQTGEIILSAKFNLITSKHQTIKNKMDYIYGLRNNNLPKQDSAGSVFKRPDYHISVGEMVEKIGLKGHEIGGAMISNQHGGIIINSNNAKAKDILSLIELIKSEVNKHFGVKLTLEQIPI
ncbi:UDP-N-acetylmuramate dehydrogenase [Francisellaceae bacterium]|nr:UDP-N-acetylmuramate dehydrogenase [Francisellaceae bacterium]